MKICIVTYAFYTSTIPLAKYLAELGNEVDLLCLTGTRSADHFTIDLTGYDSPDGFVPDEKIAGIISKSILDYLKSLNDFKIFVFSKRRRDLYFSYFLSIASLSRFLNYGKYDIVHFIGQNEIYIHLSRLMKSPRVFTFHEVHIRSNQGGPVRFRLVHLVSKKCNNVILHSTNTRRDYIEHFKPENRIVEVIRFGLFETYRLFPDETAEEPGTLLYYGIISPYKGLEFLLEAYKSAKRHIRDLKLIVAGRGNIYFDRSLLEQEGIELINRTISEEELVHLNKRAAIVVCPYLSASQSGIPVTSFVFNKPVLASGVDGIKEYVIHGYNGLLVPPGDSRALDEGIRELLTNKSLRETIKENIRHMNEKSDSEWKSIAEKTIEVYKDEIRNSVSR